MSVIPAQAGQPSNAFARPMRVLPRRPRLLFLVGLRVVSGFIRHDGLSWSAAMAFWLVLSLPPLLIALSSVAAELLGEEAAREILSEQIIAQLPAEGGLIREIVEQDIALASLAGLGALIITFFSGSRVLAALVNAINVIWRHVEKESLLRREIMRLLMLLIVGGILLTSVALQLGVAGAADDIGPLATVMARFVLPFLLVVAGLFVTYKLVPRARATWRTALLGAFLGAVVLRVAQVGFLLALETVMDFETGYGPLASIAVLMTWAIVASGVVLLGAEFVATLDRHRLRHLPLPSSSRGEPWERSV